jgi:small-conductance mechanosensitive channel
MFDLLRRWPISMGWYFDKDESGSGGKTDDSTEDKTDDKSDESKAGDEKKKAKAEDEKKFTQAELEAIIDDRLKRERKKSEDAAEKARKQAEAAALEKNQEWQKLAEQRTKDLDALTKEKTDLEPFKEQAEKYKKALDDQLAKVKATLPKYLLPLIEKMDPVEAMAYITEHAEELGAKPATYSETPEGKERKLNDEDKKKAQESSSTLITRTF